MDHPIFGYAWVTMTTFIQSLGQNLNVQEIRFQFNIPSTSWDIFLMNWNLIA